MFAYSLLAAVTLFAGSALAESHQVTFTNNCGYGTPLFLWQGGGPQGASTISGALDGGIAWLGDWSDCENSGVNCAAVEFTLVNTGYSQADITLEVGTNGEWGNHQYTYPIAFNFIDGCSTGLSCDSASCSSASFTPTQVPLVQCDADNCGINVTFC